jgi:hypothetical protein
MTVSLSNDFLLACACCRWPASDARNEAVRAAAGQVSDWDGFLRVVKRHRVAALAREALAAAGTHLPARQCAMLEKAANAVTAKSFKLAAESIRIQEAFEKARLDVVFLKGATLERLAYGRLGLKHAWDIDIFVAVEEIKAASSVLHDCGFERLRPPPSVAESGFAGWAAAFKECVFWRRQTNAFLEMHWRLADNPACLDRLSASSPVQLVAVADGTRLRTFADEELFSYLCVHGATHGWSRLKWLAEVGAFLAAKDRQPIEHLYRVARLRGAGRCAAQALLLCDVLFGLRMREDLSTELRRERKTRILLAIALNAMAGGGARKIEERAFGDLKIRLSRFLFQDDWRFLRHELSSQLAGGGTDRLRVPLPPWLHFLYPLIRIPSWLWRVVRRRGRGPLPAPLHAPKAIPVYNRKMVRSGN